MRIDAVFDAGSIPVPASTTVHGFKGNEVGVMRSKQLRMLKAVALALLLPGLAGLIVSAMFSVHYLDTMPRWPSPEELRTVPRNIHGIVVYQTAEEDKKLDLMEYSSVGVFVLGLGLGLVYLEKWGARQVRMAEEKDHRTENFGD
jgi:predicted Na+-dependent transporter